MIDGWLDKYGACCKQLLVDYEHSLDTANYWYYGENLQSDTVPHAQYI